MRDEVTATVIVPDFTPAQIKRMKEHILTLFAKQKPKQLGTSFEGVTYYEVVDGTAKTIFLLHAGTTVIYYVQHRSIDQSGFKFGRQVKVWRDRDPEVKTLSSGFTQHVLFTLLLPHHRIIAADVEQTKDGRDFWVNAIGRALVSGHKVYMFDDRKNKPVLSPILTMQDLGDHKGMLWGKTPDHKKMFALISLAPLFVL